MKVASPWDRRRPEREFLLICLGGIGLGVILVMGSLRGVGTPLGLAHLLPFLLYALSLAGLHLALVMAGFRGDQILVVAVAFLTGFGLLAQTRLGAFAMGGGESGLSDYAFVGGLGMMLAIALGFMSGRYRALAEGHWVWIWAGISLLLVPVVLITGQRFRGAVFGAGFITPTELLKVSFVLFAAVYIARQAKPLGVWVFHGLIPPWRPLVPLVGVWVALVLLLLVQRDLGMVMMLGLILPILLTLGTGRWGYLGLGLGGAGLLGWLLLAIFQHGERRIQAWLAPFQDPTGDSWQVLQGLSGMYAGGLWGEGFGAGNPEYTPIAESDFIYAVIGEELGFRGHRPGDDLLPAPFRVRSANRLPEPNHLRALVGQRADHGAGSPDLPQHRWRYQVHPPDRHYPALHQPGRQQPPDRLRHPGPPAGDFGWGAE
jgi:cell division protein FtsW (lipid II flippase)